MLISIRGFYLKFLRLRQFKLNVDGYLYLFIISKIIFNIPTILICLHLYLHLNSRQFCFRNQRMKIYLFITFCIFLLANIYGFVIRLNENSSKSLLILIMKFQEYVVFFNLLKAYINIAEQY